MLLVTCAEFSKALVTRRAFGGLMPDDLFHKDGYLWINKDYPGGNQVERLDCPDEETYFAVMQLPRLPPRERTQEKARQLAGTINRARLCRRTA